MTKPDRLDLLFDRWFDLREQDAPTSLDVVCADCPELRDPFAQLLENFDDLERFLNEPSVSIDTSSPHLAEDTGPYVAKDAERPQKKATLAFSFLSPAEEPDEIGRLAGYRILGVLDEGGMGVVFRAEEPRARRQVAVKVIRPERLGTAESRARFLREGQTAAAVDHERVVPIYRVGEANGVPFLVMPLLKGESLRVRLERDKRLPWPEAARLAREMAEGLHAAHAAGLVHRDVKPGNVWLKASPDGGTSHVLLLDFGLARAVEGGGDLSHIGAVVGTRAYMAPEQAEGREVDGRADLFSLGCVLYEMLSGRKPFAQLCPDVPARLVDLVTALLEKTPGRRPASAADVALALSDLESLPTPPVPAPPRPAPTSRRRLLAAAGILALLILAGLTAWARREPRPSVEPAPFASRGEPLVVRHLDVTHFANLGKGDLPKGRMGEKSFFARRDDGVTVEAELSRPAYAYLIAFRPDGTEELCYPESEDKVPAKSDRPRYPSVSRGDHYGLNEGEGLQAFAVVVSDEPLPPYREWRAKCSESPWGKHPATPDVVWIDDGTEVRGLTADDPAGQRGKGQDVAGKTPLAALTDWLRKAPEAKAVSAVGFAVGPKKRP